MTLTRQGIRSLVWLAALIGLAGCMKPYVLDYQTGRDFSSIQTYQIQKPAVAADQPQDLADQRVVDALHQTLPTRGLSVADGAEPDVLLTWHYDEYNEIRGDGFSWGVGYGWGVGSRSAANVRLQSPQRAESRPRETLVLQMIDPDTKQVIWSAASREPLPLVSDPQARTAEMQELIRRMLEDYPPSS